jgi:hypothetical protein
MNCKVVAQDDSGNALEDLDGAGRVEKVDGLADLVIELYLVNGEPLVGDEPPRETADGKEGRTNDE